MELIEELVNIDKIQYAFVAIFIVRPIQENTCQRFT